jgi:hypothetical protein
MWCYRAACYNAAMPNRYDLAQGATQQKPKGRVIMNEIGGSQTDNVFWPEYRTPASRWFVRSVTVLALIAGAVTFWLILSSPAAAPPKNGPSAAAIPVAQPPLWARLALICWATLPPLWFSIEYHVFWRRENQHPHPEALERFKHAQDLARNVWLAFVAVLAVLYFKGGFE